jgi:predicted dehydrogenase
MARKTLGVGFVGSGFITRFHIRSWQAVRDADVRGVWSPNRERAEEAAVLARSLGVGDCQTFASLDALVSSPEIDCIWLCGPNHRRVENLEFIADAVHAGRAHLIGIACEKPLGRTVAEARRMIELVETNGLLHGYLENQVFMPAVTRGRELVWTRGAALTGRPYLARAAEEHGGPHMPWFWDAALQGGGVLNDMMCHSVEAGRFLLTNPGARRDSLTPQKISAQIASLKWTRPDYAAALSKSMGVDYLAAPSEDFARATIEYLDEQNHPLIVEATTSWSFVGAGLRLSMELLGPEYALSINTLDAGMKLFFSRNVRGAAGEDLVEKQNAEQGLMPVIANEAGEYGYEAENRYFVRCFLDERQPEESFHAGLEVVELLMACYMSAEHERTIEWKPAGLDTYVPPVARGAWR